MKTFKDFIQEIYSPGLKKIKKGIQFGYEKHKGQVRKFDQSPYFSHPVNVSNILSKYTKDPNILISGYLHDVLEDSPTNYEEIKDKFNKKIADLVQELTSIPSEIEKLGKTEYLLKKLNKLSGNALLIKLADRLDNLSDYKTASEKFVKKTYIQTTYILDNLNRKLSNTHIKLIKKIKEILRKIKEMYF